MSQSRKAKMSPDEILEWAQKQEIPNIAHLSAALKDMKLPQKQANILVVSMLPQAAHLTAERKAELAGCSSRYYHLITKNPDCGDLVVKATKRTVGAKAGQVFNSFIVNCLLGDTQAQIKYLQEVGILKVPETANSTVNVTVINQEQRDEKLKRGLERFKVAAPVLSDN